MQGIEDIEQGKIDPSTQPKRGALRVNTVAGRLPVGTTATATGGVSSTSAAGSFSGTASAGTYWLIMAAYCEQLGGNFSYDATFTAVPAPGVFPAILMAAALRGRRRR